MSKTIPNPNRALVASLLTRLVAMQTLATDLSTMSAKNLRLPENAGKPNELAEKFRGLLMELSVLEGFGLPDDESTPEAPVAPEPPTPEYRQAVAAWRKNGFKIMGRNLEAIRVALVAYEAALVDTEEGEPPPAAEPPTAAEPPKPPPAAEPPPRAEAPKAPPKPPPATTPATPTEEGWKWWEIGCGGVVVALIVAIMWAIVWVNGYEPETTAPPAPQPTVTVAPTPAPTVTPKPTPPAPAPVAPATPTASSALDCSLAVPMPDGDMDQDGETEDYVLLTVHGGKSSLWVEGWTSDGTHCASGGNTVTNGDFDSLRKGLKEALGSNAPNEGVTNPVTVQGHKVMCDIGQGPVNNCFEG